MLLVLTATANEMRAAFPAAPAVGQGGTAGYEIGGRAVLLGVTGVGLLNTALCAGQWLVRPDVDGVVDLGIAGGYDLGGTPMGAICFAGAEVWPEYGLLDAHGAADPMGLGFAQAETGGGKVWNRLELSPERDAERMGLVLGDGWGRATGVTVSGVTGTRERADRLRLSCDGHMENMEGFAAAYAAALRGLPFLEVRTISNLVGSREPGDWNLKGALRSLHGAANTLFAA
ncbi:Futalosine hydrolase [Pseudodesulfovibrio hydrargyri]|uniref:Futalosine hydrolase n=1 Tax=Pseudodesulfovibrio hydrargyri TaxID=2125990 RepID=A0A1J5MTU1_9BACT|nr:futalosine hydrolase [Pseudodesulfovibrio hydrargyri]OIQ49426.1 Futalosine hydrolase [Pseudodesulfovibrio hydrargyri]